MFQLPKRRLQPSKSWCCGRINSLLFQSKEPLITGAGVGGELRRLTRPMSRLKHPEPVQHIVCLTQRRRADLGPNTALELLWFKNGFQALYTPNRQTQLCQGKKLSLNSPQRQPPTPIYNVCTCRRTQLLCVTK